MKLPIQNFIKKPEEFLKKDELHYLLSKIRENEVLNKHVIPMLDHEIRNGTQVVNTNNHQLILLTLNAAIATHIRFNKGSILAKFKKHPLLKRFTDIHCKVRPQTSTYLPNRLNPTQKVKRKMALLSEETSAVILDIAESIEDPKLRDVMVRIAKHRKI